MKFNKFLAGTGLLTAFLLCVTVENVSAQGRGRGGGGGRPAGVGQPIGGPGVDRSLGNASIRSGGRSDTGLGNASVRSNGRSTAGLDRARLARANANRISDNEFNRFRGLSRKLGTTPKEMRARYEAALLADPDLNYGQFVAAHMVADNLGRRYPRVTSTAILAGLANGDSLGQMLQNLRVPKDEARLIQRDAEVRIKAAKERNR
jgi:hypothetical protein